MANKTSAKPSFFEAVFQGKPKVVRAFLHGLTLGSGGDATLFFSFTDGIAHEGKVEQLAERIGLRSAGCHVVVDSDTAALLKALRKRITTDTGLEITALRRVRSARMPFTFRAYTPAHDAEILKGVKALPAGVKLQGFTHEVKSDPRSKGVEAYAAAHHYEAWGGGVLTGPVDALVAIRNRLEGNALVSLEDIELNLG